MNDKPAAVLHLIFIAREILTFTRNHDLGFRYGLVDTWLCTNQKVESFVAPNAAKKQNQVFLFGNRLFDGSSADRDVRNHVNPVLVNADLVNNNVSELLAVNDNLVGLAISEIHDPLWSVVGAMVAQMMARIVNREYQRVSFEKWQRHIEPEVT